MIDEKLHHYLLGTLPSNEEWVRQLEHQAKKDHVPIMDPLSIQFLMQLIRASRSKRILEIGTAIGYSALRMIEVQPDASIITIERDKDRYEQAIKNIEKQHKEDKIKVVYGDAKEVLKKLHDQKMTFDFIFIDAAKGQYQHFFELSNPLIKDNGMIVSDNVLFRGYVAGLSEPSRRHQKMVQKIVEYNDWLTKRSDFSTSFVPIGDGIAISIKTNNKC